MKSSLLPFFILKWERKILDKKEMPKVRYKSTIYNSYLKSNLLPNSQKLIGALTIKEVFSHG